MLVKAVVEMKKNIWNAAVFGLSCISLATALCMQMLLGLEPCPLCILQRIALMGVAMAALVSIKPRFQRLGYLGQAVFGVAGLGIAGWHWYLQAHPYDFATCTPGFSYMFENFSLAKVLPLLFKGSGSCMFDVWQWHGITIPQMSAGFFVVCLMMLVIGATREKNI